MSDVGNRDEGDRGEGDSDVGDRGEGNRDMADDRSSRTTRRRDERR